MTLILEKYCIKDRRVPQSYQNVLLFRRLAVSELLTFRSAQSPKETLC